MELAKLSLALELEFISNQNAYEPKKPHTVI